MNRWLACRLKLDDLVLKKDTAQRNGLQLNELGKRPRNVPYSLVGTLMAYCDQSGAFPILALAQEL